MYELAIEYELKMGLQLRKEKMKKITKIISSIILTTIVLIITISIWTQKEMFISFNQKTDIGIRYQIFYTLNEKEGFNETYSIRYYADPTESEIKILIPQKHISKFRMDYGEFPEKVTISNLKLVGDQIIELNNFDDFSYSPAVENKIIENDTLTIISNQKDPYMVYKNILDLNEGTFIRPQKIAFICILIFLISFICIKLFFIRKGEINDK